MTNLYRYYTELKNRFFLLLITWVSTILVSYTYKEILLFLIVEPSLSYSNQSMLYFIFTDVTEIFAVYFKIIIFLGNHVFIIFILYHAILFLSLGLYKSELKNITFLIQTSLIIFVVSVIFFNKVLLPLSWNFFLSFQSFSFLKSIDLYFESKLNEYLTFYITSYYLCITYCQIFVLLISFCKYIKNNLNQIKQYRKIVYFSFLIMSTLLTPPDIVSQIVLSLSLIFVYELLIYSLIFQLVLEKLKNQPILEHKYTRKA
uniref:SecY-independent transporter protein n=1 Tax=Haslea provincialis TaxID=1764367 RepID=UPI00220A8609|nr:SecY-independent transporter protein [Haslea provincialis]UXN44237.1 SecY-independent transporter protein [Haslea provincialis]